MCSIIILLLLCARPAAPDTRVNHATFAREGPNVMFRISMMVFFCRSFLLIVLFIVRQLPREFDVRVDSDAFFNSFSYVNEDGSRVTVGSWEDGPGWRRHSTQGSTTRDTEPDISDRAAQDLVSQKDRVSNLYSRWLGFHAKYAGHIPYAVAMKAGIRALEGWTSEEIHSKLSTVKDGKSKCISTYLLCICI